MNIIQIVSDTFRRDYLGCYGNDWIHTENLDALAEESVVFDKAYVASFPTIPHRTDVFTGKYTFIRAGWQPLQKDEITLPLLLRPAGYVTMLIVDTYHMIRDTHYFDRGFDGWWWIRGQESDRLMTNPVDGSAEHLRAYGAQYLQNVSLRRFEGDCFVAQTMDAAARWLELNYDRHEKFFLHVDTFDPHEPWDPPKWYTDMYDPDWKGGDVSGGAYLQGSSFRRVASSLTPEELKHLKAMYAGEVTLVDRWVGKLLEKIEDMGLFENTAVIFTTDHGTYNGEHGYLGKRTHLYEEVAHIPLMVRMPDSEGVKPTRCGTLAQPPDLMPTILDLAGVKTPEVVEGKSLLPLIRGEESEEREIAVSSSGFPFLAPGRDKGPIGRSGRMRITSKEWGFITLRSDVSGVDELGRTIEPELYHLPTDPNEEHNLYREKREVAEKLHLKMVKFLESMNTNQEILSLWRRMPQ